MRLYYFFYQRTLHPFAFLVLRLGGVAGWLWRFLQVRLDNQHGWAFLLSSYLPTPYKKRLSAALPIYPFPALPKENSTLKRTLSILKNDTGDYDKKRVRTR
jgi:hypothetical protein